MVGRGRGVWSLLLLVVQVGCPDEPVATGASDDTDSTGGLEDGAPDDSGSTGPPVADVPASPEHELDLPLDAVCWDRRSTYRVRSPAAYLFADFDGDGLLDLFESDLPYGSQSEKTVSLHVGIEGSLWVSEATLLLEDEAALFIELADIGGDDRPSIVASGSDWIEAYQVHDGSIARIDRVGAAGGPKRVFMDYSGDGRVDYVGVSETRVETFRGSGNGTFSRDEIHRPPAEEVFHSWGAVGVREESGIVVPIRSNGRTSAFALIEFGETGQVTAERRITGVGSQEYPGVFGDVDFDGGLELIAYQSGNDDTGLRIYSLGSDLRAWQPLPLASLSFGDVDGDGSEDVLWTRGMVTAVTPSFAAEGEVDWGDESSDPPRVVDVDGDGLGDLVRPFAHDDGSATIGVVFAGPC